MGTFSCGGVSGDGVKGGGPPSPTLCQSIRYTLAQNPRTASHLSYGEPDWSQEPLLLWELFFFFSCWVKTHCAKQHSPELVAPPPGHSSHPSCTGPKKVRHEKCPTDPPSSPTALRGSIQPLEQPCSDQEQAAQPVWGQAGDRALPWRGLCQNEWL